MRDFGSIVNEKKIPWVRHWIAATYEFSREFRKENGEMDFEALGREEYEFRKALFTGDFSQNKRAEYLWNEAISLHSSRAEAGRKGGKAKAENAKEETSTAAEAPEVVDEEKTHRTAAVRSNSRKRYPTKEEVYAFAAENNLDEADAREWYEMTAARGFKDKYGLIIKNWQGALTNFCLAKSMKRAV